MLAKCQHHLTMESLSVSLSILMIVLPKKLLPNLKNLITLLEMPLFNKKMHLFIGIQLILSSFAGKSRSTSFIIAYLIKYH